MFMPIAHPICNLSKHGTNRTVNHRLVARIDNKEYIGHRIKTTIMNADFISLWQL